MENSYAIFQIGWYPDNCPRGKLPPPVRVRVSLGLGGNFPRTTAPEENCPPTLILTPILTQTLTFTRGQFSSGAIVRTHFKSQKQPLADCCLKQVFLKSLQNFRKKHVCWSLFLLTLQVFSLIRKRLRHRCFPVEQLRWLLLKSKKF